MWWLLQDGALIALAWKCLEEKFPTYFLTVLKLSSCLLINSMGFLMPRRHLIINAIGHS
jgi:hypothetical protein